MPRSLLLTLPTVNARLGLDIFHVVGERVCMHRPVVDAGRLGLRIELPHLGNEESEWRTKHILDTSREAATRVPTAHKLLERRLTETGGKHKRN